MATLKSLADEIASALEQRGMTRRDLTHKAGVSRQAVYRLLMGHDVQLTTLLAVAAVLDLEITAVPAALVRVMPELKSASEDAPSNLADVAEARRLNQDSNSRGHVPSAIQMRIAARKGPKVTR
jgi:transcriptional regulator with XRE-family HTH domain